MLRAPPIQSKAQVKTNLYGGAYGDDRFTTDQNRKIPGNPAIRQLLFRSDGGLTLATVFVGFARTYFLAGVFRATLPSLIIHIHGAAFSSWIFLLIAQISLV